MSNADDRENATGDRPPVLDLLTRAVQRDATRTRHSNRRTPHRDERRIAMNAKALAETRLREKPDA